MLHGDTFCEVSPALILFLVYSLLTVLMLEQQSFETVGANTSSWLEQTKARGGECSGRACTCLGRSGSCASLPSA
jgi:hypothetical protein